MRDSPRRCPCGARLEREAEKAHGICDHCRVDSHRPAPRRKRTPDFEDVPLPGWDAETKSWGDADAP
jgi:hypothetical protein